MACTYFLNRKRSICVVTLNGTLAAGDAGQLESCLKAVQAEPTRFVILNLAGISAVEHDVTRPFTLFQQALRTNAKLIVCGLAAGAEGVLKSSGVLRDPELAEDLAAGLQLIIKWEKG